MTQTVMVVNVAVSLTSDVGGTVFSSHSFRVHVKDSDDIRPLGDCLAYSFGGGGIMDLVTMEVKNGCLRLQCVG